MMLLLTLISIWESMPTSLAASFEKPCKETTVEEFVSRFSQQWNYIQRSEGQFFYFEYSSKDPDSRFQNCLLVFPMEANTNRAR